MKREDWDKSRVDRSEQSEMKVKVKSTQSITSLGGKKKLLSFLSFFVATETGNRRRS